MEKQDRIFGQDDYSFLIHELDVLVDRMLEFGKTEKQAEDWLVSFVRDHYFPVWRKMNAT